MLLSRCGVVPLLFGIVDAPEPVVDAPEPVVVAGAVTAGRLVAATLSFLLAELNANRPTIRAKATAPAIHIGVLLRSSPSRLASMSRCASRLKSRFRFGSFWYVMDNSFFCVSCCCDNGHPPTSVPVLQRKRPNARNIWAFLRLSWRQEHPCRKVRS